MQLSGRRMPPTSTDYAPPTGRATPAWTHGSGAGLHCCLNSWSPSPWPTSRPGSSERDLSGRMSVDVYVDGFQFAGRMMMVPSRRCTPPACNLPPLSKATGSACSPQRGPNPTRRSSAASQARAASWTGSNPNATASLRKGLEETINMQAARQHRHPRPQAGHDAPDRVPRRHRLLTRKEREALERRPWRPPQTDPPTGACEGPPQRSSPPSSTTTGPKPPTNSPPALPPPASSVPQLGLAGCPRRLLSSTG